MPASKIAESNLSPISQALGYSFITYSFVVPINVNQSISKFWFDVNENDGSSPAIYNNGGQNYVVQQDQVLFVPTLSKMTLQPNGTILTRRGGGNPIPLDKEFFIVAAVGNSFGQSFNISYQAYRSVMGATLHEYI